MNEMLAFISSSQFLVAVIFLLIALFLMREYRAKQTTLKSLNQAFGSPNKPKEKTLKNNAEESASAEITKIDAEEAVQQFSLIATDNSEIALKRANIDISHLEIDKYVQLPALGSVRDGVVAKSALSSALGGTTQLGSVAAVNPNGIFTATVSPELLTKFGDGTYSTMIHGSKGIVQNAGYQAASTSVFAPLIVFQAMSIVTGQYYLQGITKQLENIDRKIERLVNLHHVERLAKIRHSVNLVKKLSKINHPNIEDMVSLKMMQNEIGIIHEEYAHQLSTLDLDDLKNSEKWNTSAKIEELYTKVNNASVDFNLNMAITTDEVLHLITLIEIVLNSRMSDHVKNRAMRLGELMNKVRSWDSQEFYRAKFGDTLVADFYPTVIKKAQEIYNKGNLSKGKVQLAISDFYRKEAQLKTNIQGKIHTLEMGRKLIRQMEEPVEILYISNDLSGDYILVKRDTTI